MKRNYLIKGLLYLGVVSLSIGCTNLDEEILDGVANDNTAGAPIDVTGTLQSAIEGLRDFNGQGGVYAMDEMSTDAMVGPTRGGDWDDAGVWRQIHTHTWAPDHPEVRNAWNSLLSNAYKCNLVIENGGTATQVAQARFLRAWYYYNVVDLFGQAPYREAGSALTLDPQVWSRSEATDFVISELEAVVSTLPDRVTNQAFLINKDAARFLLAKVYLNKAVFKSATSAGPYTFDAADMTKVVQNIDAITNTLAPSYWDNFKPSNNTSPEVIFSSVNNQGADGGNMQSKWRMGAHYNQTPDGWNGFTTVAEYYNTFNAADSRAKYSTPSIIANFGNPVGFQQGQMYGPEGDYKTNKDGTKSLMTKDDFENNVPFERILGGVVALKDRNNNPLVFTPALTLITSGATIETAGIRAIKYIPDTGNIQVPDNDLVLMRYSDALLMKAEAIARGGAGAGAAAIMTNLASRVGATPAATTLDGIYAERGRELWWEGWRRNDAIRFGKFLDARSLKPYVSDAKYLLYPIPAEALFNANLSQNPGY